MIKNNGCKCTNAYDPVCSMPNVSNTDFAVAGGQSTGESHYMFDLKDQGWEILMAKVLLLIMIFG